MTEKRVNPEFERLFARTLPALLRARKRAEQIAAETNTAIADWVDGKVVLTYPKKAEPSSSK